VVLRLHTTAQRCPIVLTVNLYLLAVGRGAHRTTHCLWLVRNALIHYSVKRLVKISWCQWLQDRQAEHGHCAMRQLQGSI
jgi:hypothetical protein